jgi:hypothetical protein
VAANELTPGIRLTNSRRHYIAEAFASIVFCVDRIPNPERFARYFPRRNTPQDCGWSTAAGIGRGSKVGISDQGSPSSSATAKSNGALKAMVPETSLLSHVTIVARDDLMKNSKIHG